MPDPNSINPSMLSEADRANFLQSDEQRAKEKGGPAKEEELAPPIKYPDYMKGYIRGANILESEEIQKYIGPFTKETESGEIKFDRDDFLYNIRLSSEPPLSGQKGYQACLGSLSESYNQQFDAYEKGLPISKKRKRAEYENAPPDELKGEIENVDQDFMKQLLDPQVKLEEQEIQVILNKVLPILRQRNLLTHVTQAQRAPMIAKIGFLTRNMADRLTERKYGGHTVFSSGWGAPTIGESKNESGEYIDVSSRGMSGGRQTHTRSSYHGELTEVDPEGFYHDWEENYKPTSEQINTFKETSSEHKDFHFLIRLKSPKNRLIYNIDNSIELHGGRQYYDGHAYVKGRIKPDELVGAVINLSSLMKLNWILDRVEGQERSRTNAEILEILGNNIKMPIYDYNGNLLWPERKSEEDIAAQSLQRQEHDSPDL